MGARNLKDKAQEILKNKGDSHQAEEIIALRQQVADLKDMVDAMRKAGIEEPEKKKPKLKKAA